jgi:hypothetical protein
MAISHAAGTASAAAFTWNTKCQASVASTSRVDNPRPKKAITNAAKTFERSTRPRIARRPTPHRSRAVSASPTPPKPAVALILVRQEPSRSPPQAYAAPTHRA